MTDARIEPREVVDQVEAYVDSALDSAKKYTNSQPLDESGIFSLHRLAAQIYALGFRDGELAESLKQNNRRRRRAGD